MQTLDPELKALHLEALKRQARKLVDDLDELSAAKQARDRGLNQRSIAELLGTNQAKVHRLLKAIERRSGDLSPGPEEILLRACVEGRDRAAVLEELKSFHYTDGQDAPYPSEGRIPGAWDQVVASFAKGLLQKAEFDEISTAVGR